MSDTLKAYLSLETIREWLVASGQETSSWAEELETLMDYVFYELTDAERAELDARQAP